MTLNSKSYTIAFLSFTVIISFNLLNHYCQTWNSEHLNLSGTFSANETVSDGDDDDNIGNIGSKSRFDLAFILDPRNRVRFFLYNDPASHSLESGQELIPHSISTILNSSFRRQSKTKLMIHGFVHNYSCWFPQELKDAYLSHGFDYNIIAVDWSILATPKLNSSEFSDYMVAVDHVRVAASQIASFISILHEHNLITDFSTVHLIGYSLGAHVAGLTGKAVQDKHNANIGRITGLDPAGPLYTTGLVGRCLRSTDADYVDAIHTDMGKNGIVIQTGHADFYVNGGWAPQPSCKGGDSCSHDASPNYYLQSIKDKNLTACACFDYHLYLIGLCDCEMRVAFGESSLPGTSGKFFLEMKQTRLSGRYRC